MNLYLVNPVILGRNRLGSYLEDHYVSVGWPGIGSLEESDPQELLVMWARSIYVHDLQAASGAAELHTFVYDMQDGDHVLVADGDDVYIGDIGDYYYVESADTVQDGTGHRRGVTWLNRVASNELNDRVREELAAASGAVRKFPYPYAQADLDRFTGLRRPEDELRAEQATITIDVACETIEEALRIVTAALKCDDVERRERAAIAILQYARRS